MKIAVTGATGGLGRSLVEFLLSKKVHVVALGRNKTIGRVLSEQGAEFLSGEITDYDYLKSALSEVDAVVHCAGLASPFGRWEDFHLANVTGTKTILDVMRELGIKKLVHISSPSIYFSGEDRRNITEDEPLPPQNSFYGRSKLLADELILEEVKSRQLNAVLLRPRAIVGKYDTTIVPRMVRIMKKGFFPLPNSGKAIVDVTAVENVVHAIWLCITSSKQFSGEIFNISNQQSMTVRELTSKMTKAFRLKVRFVSVPMSLLLFVAEVSELIARVRGGGEPAISKYSIQSIGTTQTLSVDKAKRELGYEPVISLEEALANLARLSQ